MDFHVVAFDYRGYADSSTHIAPTETGVVKDARAVYDWVRSRSTSKVVSFLIDFISFFNIKLFVNFFLQRVCI